MNGSLRIADLDGGLSSRSRDPARTSVRAAAVSATEIIVQRAALELDVAPEEFDALAPYAGVTSDGPRRPFLQIADTLANGSGFCRHLLAGSSIPVSQLIDSILDDDKVWPRAKAEEGDHRLKCYTSCYRCLQRYSNRNYHGLLDWRLGLSYLRAVRDPTYNCGSDGNFETYFELKDWLGVAEQYASRVRSLVPGSRIEKLGPLKLPAFSLNQARDTWVVVVHPLWDRTTLTTIVKNDRPAVFVDTFELARRPLQALQRLRSGA